MATADTLARPYAKAAFEMAVESDRLHHWSEMLQSIAEVVSNEAMEPVLDNPLVNTEVLARLVIDACGEGKLDLQARNLVRLLCDNRRLNVAPQIYTAFEEMRAESERTLDVELVSVTPVDEGQQRRLAAALERKLGRDIRLHFQTDPELIGGAIIRAGDLVIDGSVRSHLEKMASALAH